MIPPPPPATDTKVDERVDYFNLPCPIPFEELHREAMSLFPPFDSLLSLSLSLHFCLFHEIQDSHEHPDLASHCSLILTLLDFGVFSFDCYNYVFVRQHDTLEFVCFVVTAQCLWSQIFLRVCVLISPRCSTRSSPSITGAFFSFLFFLYFNVFWGGGV